MKDGQAEIRKPFARMLREEDAVWNEKMRWKGETIGR